MRPILLTAAFLLALAGRAGAQGPFDFQRAPGKLPKVVTPKAYRIDITPDLKALTLAGREQIDIDVGQPTAIIVLNQAGLKIDAASLETGAQAGVRLDEAAQIATLTFPAPVAPGRHTLTIAYTGPIPATPSGIYYDDYKNASGAAERMLVTQFEVSDARRMFPAWDEPAFKATFQLSATLPKALVAVSNMPIASSADAGPGLKHVVFEATPRMSSYLLALVAGDIRSQDGAAAGVAMHAFAPAGREGEAQYALQAEETLLPYYNGYFGVPYPLPKLDLLAIPGNYEAGAMENWGAITFIDNDMLYDRKSSSERTRETVFFVVAHEMAHQWTGDLVTLGWWDNTWLNEGFATWMENKATDHFNPDWQIWPRQHSDRETAMARDALRTTHPVHQPIRDESEANAAFDGISYQKGGQVIRMIEDWLGADVFQAGMQRYVKAHAYGNAASADLWAALSAASGRDVAAVADGFTEQPGIPLVHAVRACTGGKAALTLTQDRFTIRDPGAKPETWTIPVTLGGPDGGVQRLLLGGEPKTVPIASCGAVVKLNLGENGYYRSQYDAASLAPLRKAFISLAAVDRANLMGDAYALFEAARAPLADYLALLPTLQDERNIAVWQDALLRLRALDRAEQGSEGHEAFDRFAIGLLRPQFLRLGWDARPGEPVTDTLLRPDLIGALGLLGDEAVVAEAETRFKAFVADPAALAPGLREPVLDIVGHHADAATWETLRRLANQAPGNEEKLRYVFAMARAADPALIRRNIALAASGEIPGGRVPPFLGDCSRGSGDPDAVYALVEAQEAELEAAIHAGALAPTVLTAAASGSSNPEIARRLLAAKSSNASIGAHIQAARVADLIGTNADLRQRAAPAIAAWLAAARG